MDITGLDMSQISAKMEVILAEHFTGYIIGSDTSGIFQEVIRLAYDEIDHLLIRPEEPQLFSGGEWFNGASGIIELCRADNRDVETYTVMLVLNEQQTQALYLYASKWNATTQSDVNILIRNFTQGGS